MGNDTKLRALPSGKSCKDCQYFKFREGILGKYMLKDNNLCYFYPIRFKGGE